MPYALTAIFMTVSATFNLPPGLLSAVCFVESGHRADAIHRDDGGEDSVGLCQLQLPTARSLGFKGPARDLRRPDINAYFSGKYLRYQLDRYGGDTRKAIAAYNAGTYRQAPRGGALNHRYVSAVTKAWSSGK